MDVCVCVYLGVCVCAIKQQQHGEENTLETTPQHHGRLNASAGHVTLLAQYPEVYQHSSFLVCECWVLNIYWRHYRYLHLEYKARSSHTHTDCCLQTQFEAKSPPKKTSLNSIILTSRKTEEIWDFTVVCVLAATLFTPYLSHMISQREILDQRWLPQHVVQDLLRNCIEQKKGNKSK